MLCSARVVLPGDGQTYRKATQTLAVRHETNIRDDVAR